jgi:hypothetical protein
MEKLVAVFTGDSANYHIFQIVAESMVGSLYVRKKDENGIPDVVEVNLITPKRDKAVWEAGVNSLLEKVREGSKAESKLVKILKEYEGVHNEK